MNTFIQKLNGEIIDDLDLFGMANVRPNKTGLKMVIYISPRNNSKHGPRIKVSQQYGDKVNSDFFSITISDQPEIIGKTGNIKSEDVQKAINFVVLNKDVLLQLWYDKIDPTDAVLAFNKI